MLQAAPLQWNEQRLPAACHTQEPDRPCPAGCREPGDHGGRPLPGSRHQRAAVAEAPLSPEQPSRAPAPGCCNPACERIRGCVLTAIAQFSINPAFKIALDQDLPDFPADFSPALVMGE